MKIFVQIASYRDPELEPTVKDAIKKAKRPQNLRFGIIHQRGKRDHFTLNDHRIRIIKVDYQKSKGAGWARNQLQSLYQGEEYTLQIDSHSRFIEGWDEKLINMLESLKKEKAILSTYPAAYTPPNNLIHYNGMVRMKINPKSKFPPTFSSSVVKKTSTPPKNYFISGGFYFTRGKFIENVPYDPMIYFHGEEVALSVRAFTNGWDVYSPNDIIIYHYYGRREFPKHWTDNEWSSLEKKSKKRIEDLFKGKISGKFGLGNERSIDTYFKFTGYYPPWSDKESTLVEEPNELAKHLKNRNEKFIKPNSQQDKIQAKRGRLVMDNTESNAGNKELKEPVNEYEVIRTTDIKGSSPTEKADRILRPPLLGNDYQSIVGKVYVISLARRQDRRRHIKSELHKHGITNYEIVDAYDGHKEPLPIWWKRFPKGSYGCLMSHIKAVQKAYDDGVECAHIIEDDAILTDNFKSKFNNFYKSVPSDWDMIMTSGSHIAKPRKINDDVVKLTFSYVAHSYFIRRHMFKRFIDLKMKQNFRNDMYNTLIQLSHNVYMPSKHFSWTITNHSDNEEQNADHWWLRDEKAMYRFIRPYKTPIKDILCVIAFRDNTKDKSRTTNLRHVVDYYTKMVPEMKIVIVEQGPERTLHTSEFSKNVSLVFQHHKGKFNKGLAYNTGASMFQDRKVLMFNDSDIIIPSKSFVKSTKLLATYDSVSPYVKCLYMPKRYVDQADPEDLRSVNSLNFSNKGLHLKKRNDWRDTTQVDFHKVNGHSPLSVSKNQNVPYSGGSFFIKRDAFSLINGWFNNYWGWGAEDRAMDEKIFTFITNVYLDSYCLHLWHSRGGSDESIPANMTLEWSKKNNHHYYDNKKHLTDIRKMSKEQFYKELTKNGFKQRLQVSLLQ